MTTKTERLTSAVEAFNAAFDELLSASKSITRDDGAQLYQRANEVREELETNKFTRVREQLGRIAGELANE